MQGDFTGGASREAGAFRVGADLIELDLGQADAVVVESDDEEERGEIDATM